MPTRNNTGVSWQTDISLKKNIIADKKFHIDKLLTTILFILVGTSFTFLMLIPFILTQLLMLILVTIMAISYYKNWHNIGKAILGTLIGFGSLSFGFVLYIILSLRKTDDTIASGELPPQRFDFLMFEPVFGLLFLMIALLYFYRFKTKDTSLIEKYFSFVLFSVMTIAMALSHRINFQF